MALPLESTIVKNILTYLNNEVKGCIAEKVHGNAFQSGRPDINGCWDGACFKIEVKTPDNGNKPTKAQELNMKRWSQRKAVCLSAWSVDDVKAIINSDKIFYKEDFNGVIYVNGKKHDYHKEGKA